MAMPIYKAESMVKMYACKNATNNSMALMKTANGIATIDVATDLKMNI